ncbi:hypothetical protein DR950_32575 [Kitasatospora xanthocidica]|uniref:Uncharacterized protein n=1 Tax=Kitasatospora xanthocidica TaxID=83382 RepID=A0A373A116_9ACTN|nr:hypothetical protein [Kitasatospora xanthocidica]RGD61848.1 hypothetical protein DR950_32575 [Kitasatospora xanthocidica]
MTITQPDQGTTRSGPRRLGGALALIAVTTAVLVGVIALDVYVNSFLAAVVGLAYPLIVLYAFAVRRDADSNPRFQKNMVAWGLGISVVGFVAYLAGTEAWANLILGSGRTVQAVVVDEKVTDALHGTGRAYSLASTELNDDVPGGPLTESSPRFKRGQVITVRMDPAGRVAPKLPGEADSSAYLLAFLGCNVLIDGTVLWSVRRPKESSA